MSKTKKSTKATGGVNTYTMPAAPWIYINDPTPNACITDQVVKLIPDTILIRPSHYHQKRPGSHAAPPQSKLRVNLIQDARSDGNSSGKAEAIRILKAGAMKVGANFVSVNVLKDLSKASSSGGLDKTNHLDIAVSPRTGDEIYKWLFTVLTIPERLYLIPDEEMRRIDNKNFPQYEYCSVRDLQTRQKDAKVQFVVLILTKPQIVEGNKVFWMVADKTGVANFYFRHRDQLSQYTWDWVMQLKPGDRTALPRMPSVLIKERRQVMVAKTPLRAAAAVIGGTGLLVKQIGKCLCIVGQAAKMGPSKEWVPRADVDANGKKIDRSISRSASMTAEEEVAKRPVALLNEKNGNTWHDGASVASTQAASEVIDEKVRDLV